MKLTPEIRAAIDNAARAGLARFRRPVPQRLSEWADDHFYLSSESSYTEGRWECLSFQRGMMDVISNDDVQEVWFTKAARVGYTKMIVAATQYFAAHKKRNVAVWQPTDDLRDSFTKTDIEPGIRDNPEIRAIFPAFERKSKHNTLALKQFTASALHLLGGKAAKNYRRLSVDVAILDELDGFDHNIEREGPPAQLAARRVQGSAFPKFIAGSTPKIRQTSMIERGEAECEVRLRWHVECPHCGHEQMIRWGGRDCEFGLKWEKLEDGRLDPSSVVYRCEACSEGFDHTQYQLQAQETGRWMTEDRTVWLDPEGLFRDANDRLIDPPHRVGFHLWSGINEMVPWTTIVREWLTVQGRKEKLQGFVNLTLGEGWETDESEQMDSEVMHRTRREHYDAEVPAGVMVITVSVDTQDDRFELQYDGWGVGEERWSLAYDVIHGDPSRPTVWEHLARALRRQFRNAEGTLFEPVVACIDIGGHYGDEVAALCRRVGVLFAFPTKGLSVYGKPIVNFPRTRNDKGVYLVTVGTDTAKDLLWQRIAITEPGPGYWHWPISEDFDETYFNQLTAEEKVRRVSRGKEVFVYDAKGRRNEAWDCSVLGLVAIRIAQQKMHIDLTEPAGITKARSEKTSAPKKKRRRRKSTYWD